MIEKYIDAQLNKSFFLYSYCLVKSNDILPTCTEVFLAIAVTASQRVWLFKSVNIAQEEILMVTKRVIVCPWSILHWDCCVDG